ncbi:MULTISPECIES: hypothetical protein [unclassified Meiothermus]|uniref:hypothetical protein n=1 Tax=unclassified Meiothermus TaxID=370471 RepID=UPI000D7C749A|nr:MULTISPECIES: hypothetical protein [unclassified Meiothermus]PZA06185.1 hypothetical protein DNA98_14565 [Meiothermus sp. Pnk-1]
MPPRSRTTPAVVGRGGKAITTAACPPPTHRGGKVFPSTYARYLQLERGHSPRGVRRYLYDLKCTRGLIFVSLNPQEPAPAYFAAQVEAGVSLEAVKDLLATPPSAPPRSTSTPPGGRREDSLHNPANSIRYSSNLGRAT